MIRKLAIFLVFFSLILRAPLYTVETKAKYKVEKPPVKELSQMTPQGSYRESYQEFYQDQNQSSNFSPPEESQNYSPANEAFESHAPPAMPEGFQMESQNYYDSQSYPHHTLPENTLIPHPEETIPQNYPEENYFSPYSEYSSPVESEMMPDGNIPVYPTPENPDNFFPMHAQPSETMPAYPIENCEGIPEATPSDGIPSDAIPSNALPPYEIQSYTLPPGQLPPSPDPLQSSPEGLSGPYQNVYPPSSLPPGNIPPYPPACPSGANIPPGTPPPPLPLPLHGKGCPKPPGGCQPYNKARYDINPYAPPPEGACCPPAPIRSPHWGLNAATMLLPIFLIIGLAAIILSQHSETSSSTE